MPTQNNNDTDRDAIHLRCDVTFDPEDHALRAKRDGRDRGLWFYTGPYERFWEPTTRPALLTWKHLKQLKLFLDKEIAKHERR